MTTSSCYTCEREAEVDALPPREVIAIDEHWRVAHAFDAALPGWLVLLPRRHVTAIAELTDAEAAVLGTWQVRLSRALHAVTGCAKTYVLQYAEAPGLGAPGFGHVHFHVVPRAADLPQELRGPRVFGFLEREPISPEQMDAFALRLREALGEHAAR
jgi:diadenosine tetraphosphate (Ap4A) HIT family hydrolase